MARAAPHSTRHPPPGPSEATEDYAKAIYAISQRAGGTASTSALAERLGVSPGSVTAMLKRMEGMGLVTHELYRGAGLTAAGERVALEVLRHHRLLEAYLVEALGVPWDRVHAEAEVLEHHISEELEERIAAVLGDPRRDPHGDPIPAADLSVETGADRALTELEAGATARVVRVSDSDPDTLRFLARNEIVPGVEIEVLETQPMRAGLRVRVAGGERFLGFELAQRVRARIA